MLKGLIVKFILEDGQTPDQEIQGCPIPVPAEIHHHNPKASIEDLETDSNSMVLPCQAHHEQTLSGTYSRAHCEQAKIFYDPLHLSHTQQETPPQFDTPPVRSHYTAQWTQAGITPSSMLSVDPSPLDNESPLSSTPWTAPESDPCISVSRREACLLHHYIQKMAPWVRKSVNPYSCWS